MNIRTDGPFSKAAGRFPVIKPKERADARRNRESILAAADRLFAAAPSSRDVSMDDVAAAAGVGKGTLFRRFGDRDGLLQSLIAEKQRSLQQLVVDGTPPLGPGGPGPERVRAIVDALVTFKLENRYLMLAFEGVNDPYSSAQYTLWHTVIADALTDSGAGERASFLAHALLAALRSDLIEYLLKSGLSAQQVKSELSGLVDTVVPKHGCF